MGEYAPPLGPPAARAAAAHRRTVRGRSGHLVPAPHGEPP